MNNLEYFRKISGVTPKQLARLLNVSVHTYRAFEQERISISQLQLRMLGKIYSIKSDSFIISIEKVSESTINNLQQLSTLTDEQRYSVLCNNLTDGSCSTVTYRDVRKAKEKIVSSLDNETKYNQQ